MLFAESFINWGHSLGPLLAVMAPMVGVPLTFIMFHLRAMRENQITWQEGWSRRLDALEAGFRELRQTVREFERDYTTKEEWLRECMYARHRMEQMSSVSKGT